jgi:hypothetical protein
LLKESCQLQFLKYYASRLTITSVVERKYCERLPQQLVLSEDHKLNATLEANIFFVTKTIVTGIEAAFLLVWLEIYLWTPYRTPIVLLSSPQNILTAPQSLMALGNSNPMSSSSLKDGPAWMILISSDPASLTRRLFSTAILGQLDRYRETFTVLTIINIQIYKTESLQ